MQLPLHMIKVAEDSGIMVEVKSGETYNGILRGVDRFMNIKIGEAVLTDKVTVWSCRMGRPSAASKKLT